MAGFRNNRTPWINQVSRCLCDHGLCTDDFISCVDLLDRVTAAGDVHTRNYPSCRQWSTPCRGYGQFDLFAFGPNGTAPWRATSWSFGGFDGSVSYFTNSVRWNGAIQIFRGAARSL